VKHLLIAIVLAACGGGASSSQPTGPSPQSTQKVLVSVDERGVGLRGLDPVSYTKGEPAEGAEQHAARHGGATYWFASADARAAFEAAPAKLAPQFGGYCAFAAAQNRLSVADPRSFLIYEGQLLVFTNADFKTQFEADPAGNKRKADANWPGLVAQHGK
jgi:YHS domain-containing protein